MVRVVGFGLPSDKQMFEYVNHATGQTETITVFDYFGRVHNKTLELVDFAGWLIWLQLAMFLQTSRVANAQVPPGSRKEQEQKGRRGNRPALQLLSSRGNFVLSST